MNVDIVVVGGGAAGLMAAGVAASNGANVLLVEKKTELAKKVRLSGKGRCNITNAADLQDFIQFYPGNGRFLYGALYRFSNQDVIDFFAARQVPTKVERGKRVFPVSDDANQVAEALARFARENNVQFSMGVPVKALQVSKGQISGVVLQNGQRIWAPRVILATGGASYPVTGSTGDGYQMAAAVGHTIIPIRPSLVPLRVKEKWVPSLAGLSLRNIEVTITNGRQVRREFGEMQFAHFGLTGPIILTLSRQVGDWLREGASFVELSIDLKPALTPEALDKRLQRDFSAYARKQFKNSLGDLLPKSLIPVVVELSGIDPAKWVHQITKEERLRLGQLLKALPLTVTSTLPIAAAIVTAGGVDVREVDPKTMESKLVPGLYFAGEVLDIDGVTGGFNLQAAFSTGYVAGWQASQAQK